MEMAKEEGPYSTLKGSPISKGEFQHNLWGH
jgi:ribonucleoside-diphosphate reductase alpha chain